MNCVREERISEVLSHKKSPYSGAFFMFDFLRINSGNAQAYRGLPWERRYIQPGRCAER